jgi:hypothetical protein
VPEPELSKAAVPGVGPGVQTFTAAQVAAMLNAIAVAPQIPGGFTPLPRTDPQVAFGPDTALIPAQIDPVRRDTGRPEPRFNEYPVSANLPGIDDRLVPWKVLRDAASSGGIPRRCIEIRKAEVAGLEWAITLTKDAVEAARAEQPDMAPAVVETELRKELAGEIARCTRFLKIPDRGQDEDFAAWISKLLEEHLVLDAIAIYPRRTYGGDLYALEVLDGATIKRLRDHRGGVPQAPQPAYQQELWGFPRGEYTAALDDDGNLPNAYLPDALIYKRRNIRAHTLYGYSAVEQCLEDLDVWLKRRQWIRSEFTDGAVPTGFVRINPQSAGASWTPAQVMEYETALNDSWSGQTASRHRMRILPPGFELETQPDVAERYRPEYDLFLLKQLAAHFDTTIAELGFTEQGGLGSTGWHEGQADVQQRKGTLPTLRWLQQLVTSISRTHLGMPAELEFRFVGLEEDNEAEADKVADERVKTGRMTYNEDRDRQGKPRYDFPEADMPMVQAMGGIVFLEGASKLAAPGQVVQPVEPSPRQDKDRDGRIDPTQEVDEGAEAQDGEEDDGDQADAVKTELAAYRRWAKRNPTPSRPFAFTTVTKADAPHLTDAPVAFATPDGGDSGDPKAGDLPAWPGWERDEATADLYARRIIAALDRAVDCEALAERWLARELVKADTSGSASEEYPQQDDSTSEEWALALAAAFLAAQSVDLTAPLAAVLGGLWVEGYAIGAAAAAAVQRGKSRAVFSWRRGDADAAWATLTQPQQDSAKGFRGRSASIVQRAADGRRTALAKLLTKARGARWTAKDLARRLRAVLTDKVWARAVALTETTRASSQAATDVYEATGGTQRKWQVEDADACATCQTNAASPPVAVGGMWPDGSTAPPAHPNCRCWLYPA